ncbi:carboxypeptidase-like regulatory domain-containing protein [Leeuwenhoekiella parthenopeia]|uniref:Carboxypeptidase-like regulatory domain-containing protein n=1 Tax=Leeuwenhoekiella parthenopeia TaxID=2890320 RepID=A0ABS8GXH6_9FLAO|nr:carboxypeptidase-like regulatory domain-containing protein [Leeuwenhoekiella parthenopeia]MCC4214168.1 carboxypeptidase-like regulatory domain-containing protein [Leeuwenhoekiella parthenopeia]
MHFKLHIPEPCHEDWSQMSEREQGRFCASCAKEVIDFTALSRKQITEKVQSGKSICGRYRKDQLETTYFIPEKKAFKNLGIAAAFTSLLALCEPAMGQETEVKTEQTRNSQENKTEAIKLTPKKDLIIEGTVLDQNDYPLPGANIMVSGSDRGTVTDFDGNFKIEIPLNETETQHKLVCSFIGFKTQEVDLKRTQNTYNFILAEDPELMSLGMVVVGGIQVQKQRTNKPRSRWSRFH